MSRTANGWAITNTARVIKIMVNVGVRKEGGMAKRMVYAEKRLLTKSSERFGFNLRINS